MELVLQIAAGVLLGSYLVRIADWVLPRAWAAFGAGLARLLGVWELVPRSIRQVVEGVLRLVLVFSFIAWVVWFFELAR